jgi:radical SAM superfamily enzyme YgiQ (UPF0313 family)
VIAFTLQYELDYFNVLWIIDSIGIPFTVAERSLYPEKKFPLLIGGGPCVRSNPLPMLNFLDLIVFGDLEPISDRIIKFFTDYLPDMKNFSADVKSFSEALSKNEKRIEHDLDILLEQTPFISDLHSIPNLLVSHLTLDFLNDDDANGLRKSFYSNIFPVKRIYLKILSESFVPIRQIIPEFENKNDSLAFGETFLMEINRGCPYGCRFCLTGYLNRPFRNRSLKSIKEIVKQGINETRVNKVTLIGSSIADHPEFEEICKYIVNLNLKIMVPSLRINKLTTPLLQILKRGGLKSITVAPETGSEHLRKSLNKNINDKEIIDKCELIFSSGFESIKFYFLIGLPFELENDINAIASLMLQISNELGKKIPYNGLRLSVNCFIPKLFTPYASYTKNFKEKTLKYFKKSQQTLKKKLKSVPNLVVNFMNIKEAKTQAVFSQIDDSFGDFLKEFYLAGGRPVELTRIDRELNTRLQDYMSSTYNSFQFFLKNENQNDSTAVWASGQMKRILKIVDFGFKKDTLMKELLCAKNNVTTQGCSENCHRCGIC